MFKLPNLFKQDSTASSSSTSTDDTVRISDSDDLSIQIVSDSDEKLEQDSPKSPLLFDRPTLTAINQDSEESEPDSSQIPALVKETTCATIKWKKKTARNPD